VFGACWGSGSRKFPEVFRKTSRNFHIHVAGCGSAVRPKVSRADQISAKFPGRFPEVSRRFPGSTIFTAGGGPTGEPWAQRFCSSSVVARDATGVHEVCGDIRQCGSCLVRVVAWRRLPAAPCCQTCGRGIFSFGARVPGRYRKFPRRNPGSRIK
jgi:hypothetical protein